MTRVGAGGAAILAVLLVLRFTAFGGPGPAAPARVLTPAPCSFPVASGEPLPPTTCGTMEVPERRDVPGSRTIQVAYAVFHATAPHPAPDPLVYLPGGPGGAALHSAAGLYRLVFSAITGGTRDVVLLDPRGTGTSTPSLDCSAEVAAATSTADFQQRLADCHDRLRASGIDLDAYGSAAIAADVDDLMHALGYGAYNVIGISYGTHVALTLLRDRPARVRSVILDSTVPLDANVTVDAPASFAAALAALSGACAAQPACGAASPDLEGSLLSLAESLQRDPRVVPFGSAPGGIVPSLRVDGTVLLGIVSVLMHSDVQHPDQLATLPASIRSALHGDFAPLVDPVAEQRTRGSLVAIGDYYSVTCREQAAFTNVDAALAAVRDLPPAIATLYAPSVSTDILQTCGWWTNAPANPADRAPVYSRVPALVLAGGMDPITPPAYGRQAAADLPQSKFLLFPGSGHALAGQECPDRAMAAFLDAPGAPLGVDCLAHRTVPAFAP
jgi:pimeloyl-ACP methyl ester carboxylesterase